MSQNSRGCGKRNLLATGLILLLVAYGVWDRENYLFRLREKEVRLNNDLQAILRQNRILQLRWEVLENLAYEKKYRRELETAISKNRALPFRQPVRYRYMEKIKLKDYIISKLGSQYTAEEFQNYELALKQIGLLPKDVHLKKVITELLSEQIAAFYDPDTHELYTFTDPTTIRQENNFERMILAHELVHVLQDQNFDFRTLALRTKNNDDAALAAAALVEGDANYHMTLYLWENYQVHEILGDLQLLFSQKVDEILAAPPYLRDSLLFPYQEGQRFVAELYARGGNAAIDAAFLNPPQSTEQVLHPQKYLNSNKDVPKPVSLIIKASPSWKKLHENVVGELGIRSFFSEILDEEKAAHVAAGWGGDRYILYGIASDQRILVWKTVWDTEKDAREFFDALEGFYRIRYQLPESTKRADTQRSAALATGPDLSARYALKKEKAEPKAGSAFFSIAQQKQNITIQGYTVWFLDVPNFHIMNKLLLELISPK